MGDVPSRSSVRSVMASTDLRSLSPPPVPPPAFPHSPAPQSPPVADPCSNALFYIGALRLPLDGTTQEITETDFYYSGIYVEDSGPTTAL